MNKMNLKIKGIPIEKRLQRLKHRLDKAENANKREKLVRNIQRLELKQKIQILKALENGPCTPEKQLEILATRLDLVKITSPEKQKMSKDHMKNLHDKIIARQEKKKNLSNKEVGNTATVDGNGNKKGKLSITDRFKKQKRLLEEENDPVQRQVIANRIKRISNRIEGKEQCLKRTKLQQKISLFKESSGAKKLSKEQRLEVLMDRLELVTCNFELARNHQSRRQKIEKHMEALQAKIASITDANKFEQREYMEKGNIYKEGMDIKMKGNKN